VTAPTTTGADVSVEIDPRDPLLRLQTFFDDGTLELITARDDSGMLAGTGLVEGTPAVAFASDATIQGGAMGEAGCAVQQAVLSGGMDAGSGDAGPKSYSTTFLGVENPISENGVWTNGGVVGLKWQDVRKENGFAFGSGPSAGYDDCMYQIGVRVYRGLG
jgi:hypothetical protein